MGVRFSNSYHSDALERALDFIMKNQDEFTRPADAWRSHLVLIQPPTAELAAEAAAWVSEIQASAKRAGGTEARAGRRTSPRTVPNPATSDPRATAITANGSFEFAKSVDHRSGFPNGPWSR